MRADALAATVTVGAAVDAATFRPGTLRAPAVYAALAALAERPALVRAALGPRIGTCFAVNMTLNGKRAQVLVDDWVLAGVDTPHLSTHARVEGAPGELWPAILEKACAKTRGGYAIVAEADDCPIQLLADFTSFPASRQDDGFAAARDDPSKVAGKCHIIAAHLEGRHLVIVRVANAWIAAVKAARTPDGVARFLKVRTTNAMGGNVACALSAAYWAEHPDAAAACGAPDTEADEAARTAWIDLPAAVALGVIDGLGVL
jgi:hypothetical protein